MKRLQVFLFTFVLALVTWPVLGSGPGVAYVDIANVFTANQSITATNLAATALSVRYNGTNPLVGFGIANGNGFGYVGWNTIAQASSDTPKYDITGAAGRIWLNNTTGTMTFETAASGTAGTAITLNPSMSILSSGNVGINLTSPQVPLDVNSTSVGAASTVMALRNTDTTSGAGASFYFVTGTGSPGNSNALGLYRAASTSVGPLVGDLIYFNNIGGALTEQLRLVGSTSKIRFTQYGAGTLSTDASGNISATSDERLKERIQSFPSGLDAISQLHPISFYWREESGLDRSQAYIGFSAQNVETVLPSAVGMDRKGFKTLSDRVILAALVNSVQELNARVKQLETQK